MYDKYFAKKKRKTREKTPSQKSPAELDGPMVLTDLGEVGHEGGDVQPVGEAVQNGVDARQGGLSEGLAVVDLKEKTREVEVCARVNATRFG